MGNKTVNNIKDNRFELLKELLLEDDRQKFTALSKEIILKEKLEKSIDPLIDKRIEDLRQNFPEYFGTTITETIKSQIRNSQDEVVDALYPIMGKLIKKAIVSEITKLSERINKTISEKFSVKQIFKRFIKGKNTDADDILQEVFEASIEQVFIIEKDSGLLFGNYSKGDIADKDMISGMLTAIKSFAEDAFSKENQSLEDIKFDNFQLTIISFNTVYIAIATSGVLTAAFKEKIVDNTNNLAEVILRERKYLKDETKLNVLIERHLIA
ncbi:cell envelope biogenesis protein OmpA [uncultured Polaribacter sp.]|uniref:cell envelope biogenesis protein OmpA n=1 Tax=uncultured Polaribacter sp. TaxID=174711 RepID=UPI00260D7550|nr:cell envelope biogenesis protein OmpA [uncultured Polaribacter sp.]